MMTHDCPMACRCILALACSYAQLFLLVHGDRLWRDGVGGVGRGDGPLDWPVGGKVTQSIERICPDRNGLLPFSLIWVSSDVLERNGRIENWMAAKTIQAMQYFCTLQDNILVLMQEIARSYFIAICMFLALTCTIRSFNERFLWWRNPCVLTPRTIRQRASYLDVMRFPHDVMGIFSFYHGAKLKLHAGICPVTQSLMKVAHYWNVLSMIIRYMLTRGPRCLQWYITNASHHHGHRSGNIRFEGTRRILICE